MAAKAKRYGIVVKKVTLPRPVKDAPQVLNLFNDAITPRTRVIFFSHITTVTGVVLPAKELCALARSKGILSAVDGAHVTGMMQLNVHDIGCDMYSSSPHKWLQAPKGSGFLYVRDEVIDRMWNTIATEGWNDDKLRAERFQRIGSLERAGARRTARGDPDGQRHRHGHASSAAIASSANYMLAEMTKRGAESVDLARPEVALRDCDGQRPAHSADGVGRLDVEDQEDSHPRRGPVKAAPVDPVLLAKKDIERFLDAFDEYKKMNPS